MTFEEIRISKGWSLEETANLYGVDIETLINYEKYIEFPNMKEIATILMVTGLDYDDIIYF